MEFTTFARRALSRGNGMDHVCPGQMEPFGERVSTLFFSPAISPKRKEGRCRRGLESFGSGFFGVLASWGEMKMKRRKSRGARLFVGTVGKVSWLPAVSVHSEM